MTDAPERIWADGNQDWDSGSWGQDKEYANDVEYVRADCIAELEETLALRTNLHGEATYLIHKLEAKLEKAMLALDEAIYLLDLDDEDIAKETGLHRIVTNYKELKGQNDE